MRILFADDQDDLRLLTKQRLESLGHDILAVANGEEALRAFRQERFDFILLDEEMPGMSGTEVLRAIRAAHRQSPTLVFALTGYNTETDRDRLLRDGFDGVFGKPFRLDLLEATLRSLAGKGALPAVGPASSLQFPSPAALARLGGDEQLLRRLAQTFLQDLPPRLVELQNSIEQGEGERLASTAHALKGSLSIFGADRAAACCRQLQQFAKSSDFLAAASVFGELKEAIAELEPNLRGYAGQKRTTGKAAAQPKNKHREPGSQRKKP